MSELAGCLSGSYPEAAKRMPTVHTRCREPLEPAAESYGAVERLGMAQGNLVSCRQAMRCRAGRPQPVEQAEQPDLRGVIVPHGERPADGVETAAVGRVKYGPPGTWAGACFSVIHDQLVTWAQDGPGGPGGWNIVGDPGLDHALVGPASGLGIRAKPGGRQPAAVSRAGRQRGRRGDPAR